MGNLSASQLKEIHDFLTDHGLTYDPLREEMVDHVCCDIERYMSQGYTYEAAWQKVLKEIPPVQLQTLQLQTMETISKKPSLSKLSAYLSFFLLFASAAFKLLHLPGAGELLIASMGAIAFSLISGSITGIYFHKDRTGAWLLISIVLSALLFLNSLVFQILHLPGATEFRTTSVLALSVLFPLSFFYVRNKTAQILPYLHEKYTPAITRFIVILFGAACTVRITLLTTTGSSDVMSRILMVVVIAAAGLHFFAIGWHNTKAHEARSVAHLVMLSISFLCFILPGLVGVLSPVLRTVLVTGFFISAGMQVLSLRADGSSRIMASVSVALVMAVQLHWAFATQGILQLPAFHVVTILALLAVLLLQRKNLMMSMYLITFIAHYLFVYPWELPY